MKKCHGLIPTSDTRKAIISIVIFAGNYFHETVSIGDIDKALIQEGEPPLTQEEIKDYKLDNLKTKVKK